MRRHVNHPTVLFLHLLLGNGVEDWWQGIWTLHESVLVDVPFVLSCNHRLAYVVFEVTVKSMLLNILNFEICKVTSTMLSCQWPFLHIELVDVLIFLLLNDCLARGIIAVLCKRPL